MRIAQIAPLYESVPPRYYGGTERVVSYLTEELVRQGHEVTLFASGDSVTSARLVSCAPQSLRLSATCADPLPHFLLMLERVYEMADDFDVLHFHIDYIHFPLTRRYGYPSLTTLHGRLDIPDLVPLYRKYIELPVTSISDSQRSPLPWLNWRGTVLHGIPADLLPFRPDPGSYLAFLGRVSPEKGLDTAIAIATGAGVPLKIAAKVDAKDREFFEAAIRPLLDNPLVEFIGEIGESDKRDFLGNALALLFPICWEEPFGLVMIEAMACGTPVVAFGRGSVPEVIDNGLSGFIVRDVPGAVQAVKELPSFKRLQCRRRFEERFSVARMARDYLDLYADLTTVAKTKSARVGSNVGSKAISPSSYS